MNALVRNHRRSLTILVFFCLSATAWGQPKAAFSAKPLAGCSPLIVYFSDSSTGNPTQWKWDLGNGVTSFLRNPSATYFNPGTYTIKLVVSNANGVDSVIKKEYISVYAAPTVDFNYDKTVGCFPLPVQFSSKSIAGSGTIASWQWEFGDGTISTQANPSHTYATAGNFNVTLRVTNSFGCVSSFTKTGAIQISDGVKASFTNTNPGLCPAPATTQFTNTSTGPGPLSFQWNFGDGTTSNAINPSHTYNNNGNYSVSLIATSPQGCRDTIKKDTIFRIGSAKAGFTAPANICVNKKATFTNTSFPAPQSVKWDFGDGTTSTASNPEKVYTRSGVYTVQLISNFGSCFDTVQKVITVSAIPVADFTATKQLFCNLPVNIQFASVAADTNLQYVWDFGDGNTGTTSNPTHTYTKEGTYSVRLIVTNAGGCSDTITKKDFIKIQKPRILLAGLPMNGCLPITIKPTATVTSGQIITSYLWNFGDGNTSTEAAPTHTYSTAGTYDVRLVVTTADGCTDTTVYTRAVRVGEKPKAAFEFKPSTVCPFEKVFFTDKSTGNVDQWFWNFHDGGTSTQQNPFHQFSDTGWQHVSLVVFNNTCPDTILIKNAVYVNPPVSIFSVKDDCNDKFTKQFTDRSRGPKTWFWEFGDGKTSTEQSPAHTYAAAGTYTVKLTVTNGSCTHFSTRRVMAIDEKANFTVPDTIICRNDLATFTAAGINSANISSWSWDFGNGTTSRDANKAQHRYTKAGTYTVTLTITDLLGCRSTKNIQLKVYGPTANFAPSAAVSCLKDNVITFNDASTTDGQHPVVKWIWNYGNNKLDSSSVVPHHYSYDSAGTYNVSLTVVDAYGCRDSRTVPAAVVIARPVAVFSVSDTSTCTDRKITFNNASKGITPSFAWSFGDGNKSTATSPAHSYSATGVYSIKLVVTDKYGCKDSLEKQDLITVSYPKAKFSLSDSVGTCPPLLVHFTNESSNYKSILWNFGDGNTSRLEKPSHFYTTPGTFHATLVATGPGGCTDTVRKTIVVKGPSGTFSYAPITGCKPLTVNFKASTQNSASFIWDFSDGSTAAAKTDTTSHTFVTAGEYVPKMILIDDGGCQVPIEGKDTIRVMGVTTDFSTSAITFCDRGTVQFTNRTVSNDFITGYHWSFGDGNTSTALNPAHTYAKPGNYTVNLLVTTRTGCSDQKVMTDTVKVYQSPSVQIEGDTASCAPATFTFTGKVNSGNASLLKWDWNLANGQRASVQNPVPQVYSTDGSYTITTIATDNHGCRDTANRKVTVYPVPKTNAGADQWICRGSFYQLKATGATTYQWQAASSLSCTDCDSPLAAPADSTQFIVTGYNSFGCSRSDSVTIRVHQPFTLKVEKGDTICVGKTVNLLASGADQYNWSPSLGVKNPTAGKTTATPQTSTLYKVVAKDNAGCFTDTGHVYIKVWPIPTINVATAQTLAVGNTLTLKPGYSADVTSYQWSNAQTLSCATCPSPTANPKTETKYTVEVKNDGGCTNKESITVNVICNDGNLFIPNTFSPNGDGTNDRFYPRGTGISSIKSLKVFNRWGELVFSREDFNANDAAAGWDGTLKGQILTSDIYVYTCEVVCMNHEVLTFKGDITLLR